MAQPTTAEVVKTIWMAHGLPEAFLKNLILTELDPDLQVPSSFHLGIVAQSAVALSGLSAAYLHYLRTNEEQTVTVDPRHASLSFHSEAWYTLDGEPPAVQWDSIAGLYKMKDNRWVRIHTNFPHHRAAILSILSLDESMNITKNDIASAFAELESFEFEQLCLKSHLPVCAVIMRTREEWVATEHGKALLDDHRELGARAPVEIHKISESAPRRRPPPGAEGEKARPLSGVQVLDLSRVLAGPIAGRTLAAHGAQTLLVTSPKLPSLPSLDIETLLGKRTTQLDLTQEGDRDILCELARQADVFLQAYRPGSLEQKGFGSENILHLGASQQNRPAVIYAHLCAWGWNGPWKDRRGFDSLVQTATGLNVDEGLYYAESQQDSSSSMTPRPFPMQILDHAAGYFLSFGVCTALCHQITEGGSYEVRLSLAGVAEWVRSLGRLSPHDAFVKTRQFPRREDDEVRALSVEWLERPATSSVHRKDAVSMSSQPERLRRMTALRHAAILSKTPVREGSLEEHTNGLWGAPMRLDADNPAWMR